MLLYVVMYDMTYDMIDDMSCELTYDRRPLLRARGGEVPHGLLAVDDQVLFSRTLAQLLMIIIMPIVNIIMIIIILLIIIIIISLIIINISVIPVLVIVAIAWTALRSLASASPRRCAARNWCPSSSCLRPKEICEVSLCAPRLG